LHSFFLETFFEKKVSNFQKTLAFYICYFGFSRFLEISKFFGFTFFSKKVKKEFLLNQ